MDDLRDKVKENRATDPAQVKELLKAEIEELLTGYIKAKEWKPMPPTAI